jgi:hypothetical protein
LQAVQSNSPPDEVQLFLLAAVRFVFPQIEVVPQSAGELQIFSRAPQIPSSFLMHTRKPPGGVMQEPLDNDP